MLPSCLLCILFSILALIRCVIAFANAPFSMSVHDFHCWMSAICIFPVDFFVQRILFTRVVLHCRQYVDMKQMENEELRRESFWKSTCSTILVTSNLEPQITTVYRSVNHQPGPHTREQTKTMCTLCFLLWFVSVQFCSYRPSAPLFCHSWVHPHPVCE